MPASSLGLLDPSVIKLSSTPRLPNNPSDSLRAIYIYTYSTASHDPPESVHQSLSQSTVATAKDAKADRLARSTVIQKSKAKLQAFIREQGSNKSNQLYSDSTDQSSSVTSEPLAPHKAMCQKLGCTKLPYPGHDGRGLEILRSQGCHSSRSGVAP